MSQIIMRILDSSEEVEIYKEEDTKAVFEKIITKDALANALARAIGKKNIKSINIDLMDEYDNSTLFIKQSSLGKTIYYNFTQRKIKCQYDKKGYNIDHPNSIFVLHISNNIVQGIKAFCYKDFKGKSTELYKYPLSNMLGQNAMCLGTIDNNYATPLKSILNAVEANYTHTHTGFTQKPFASTKELFEYLSNHPFPSSKLEAYRYTLGDLITEKIEVRYDE